MRKFVNPIVIVSKCLGFAHCRYNGLIISDDFIKKLQPHVQFIPICPELEIGLGVPRDPVRVVSVNGELRLIHPATNTDLTDKMRDFVVSFLNAMRGIDGFILKSRSPSCGMKEVKVYPGIGKVAAISKGAGFFGKEVMRRYSHLAVETDDRLRNYRIREHFLTKLFTFSSFRGVKASNSIKELLRFQSENKFLLMASNQKELINLDRIVANHEGKPIEEVMKEYEQHLNKGLLRRPRYASNLNVLMQAIGYFPQGLSNDEKTFFLESFEKYRTGMMPLSFPLNILKSSIIRFGEKYLMQQTFFEPYPEGLVELTDSGR